MSGKLQASFYGGMGKDSTPRRKQNTGEGGDGDGDFSKGSTALHYLLAAWQTEVCMMTFDSLQ